MDTAFYDASWEAISDFFGLETPSAAAAAVPVPIEDVCVEFGIFPHQRSVVRRALERIGDGRGRTLVHMPTGSGKTRTAMHIISSILAATEPAVVVWLASSLELVEQAAEAFQLAWPRLGDRPVKLHRFWGGHSETPESLADGILVAGLAKMHSWREREPLAFQRFASSVRLVVIDEAHQSIAPTYRALIDDLCGAGRYHSLLGLTATPGRTWNDVVADQELSDFFNGSKVVLEIGDESSPVSYLIAEGYLARPNFSQIGYASSRTLSNEELARLAKSEDIPDDLLEKLAESIGRNLAIISSVRELVARGHVRIIVFAVSIKNAAILADALVANGVPASVVTGETIPARRAAILRAFKSGSPQPMVVCNFGVLTTGFDAPRTSAAIIARPTKSLVLFSQMVGRATRGPKAGGNSNSEILTVHDPSYPGFGDIAEAFFNWEDVWNGN